jgi:hypothetical protein
MTNQSREGKTSNDHVSIIETVQTPLGFFTLVVLVVELVLGGNVYSSQGADRTYLVLGMLALIFLLVIIVAGLAIFRPEALSGKRPGVSKIVIAEAGSTKPEGGRSEPAQLFYNTEIEEFVTYFKELAYRARRVVLIGTGIKILHTEDIRQKLVGRTKMGCKLEVYAANPYSPAVETRLIEEETWEANAIGRQGMKRLLETMLRDRKTIGDPSNFSLKLFSHYPTMALLILDDEEYFVYPYGYARFGTSSPVIHYSKKNHEHQFMIKFLDEQYELIRHSAVDAQLVCDLHNKRKVSLDKLVPFAVYFVPEAQSPLYKFGSQVLEYDLHAGHFLPVSPLHDYVGAAASFGFHLTVADALYCVHPDEIKLIAKEIEFIAQEFQPFHLTVEFRKNFPTKQSISLVCKDDSGSLEALHHEMVCRCCRKAVASNYDLEAFDFEQAKQDRVYSSEPRTSLIKQHYHAPYILQQFRPHFSLLTTVPPGQMDQVFQEIKDLYGQMVREPRIEARKLTLMTKPQKGQPWQIEQEINLTGVWR